MMIARGGRPYLAQKKRGGEGEQRLGSRASLRHESRWRRLINAAAAADAADAADAWSHDGELQVGRSEGKNRGYVWRYGCACNGWEGGRSRASTCTFA